MNIRLKLETSHIDLTPYAMARMSDGLFNASENYLSEMEILNSFLLSASIELGLKSSILSKDNSNRKKEFLRSYNIRHDMEKAYLEFRSYFTECLLNQDDIKTIRKINPFYRQKGLEYITTDVIEALANGLSSFPELSDLRKVASKVNIFLKDNEFFISCNPTAKNMKKQVVLIGGGETFDTYEEYISFLNGLEIDIEAEKIRGKGWKRTIGEKLGGDFEAILVEMPNSLNAKYAEWKIMFEKFFPFLRDSVVLIGHSLGGIFLAKYLSENIFPRKIAGAFLVAAPFGDKDFKPSLGDFVFSGNLDRLAEQGGRIILFHSKDDQCVPFSDLEKYRHALPKVEAMVFEDRGHFNQQEFPEMVEAIQKI